MLATLATGIVSAESMQLEYAASDKLESSSLLEQSTIPIKIKNGQKHVHDNHLHKRSPVRKPPDQGCL